MKFCSKNYYWSHKIINALHQGAPLETARLRIKLIQGCDPRLSNDSWISTTMAGLTHLILSLPQLAALSRKSFTPPTKKKKMVQLSIQILYERAVTYKILKPLSLINLDIFMFLKKCVNISKPWQWRYSGVSLI